MTKSAIRNGCGQKRKSAGENEYDNKNEVPETTGASTGNLLALAISNQLNERL